MTIFSGDFSAAFDDLINCCLKPKNCKKKSVRIFSGDFSAPRRSAPLRAAPRRLSPFYLDPGELGGCEGARGEVQVGRHHPSKDGVAEKLQPLII